MIWGKVRFTMNSGGELGLVNDGVKTHNVNQFLINIGRVRRSGKAGIARSDCSPTRGLRDWRTQTCLTSKCRCSAAVWSLVSALVLRLTVLSTTCAIDFWPGYTDTRIWYRML